MMKLYKTISHKHEQDEVLGISMYQSKSLPSYCEEQEVYLQDLDSDEKDLLILDMMDQIDKLKVQLDDFLSTWANFRIGG